MKVINQQLLDKTTAEAKQSLRLRMNYNFHDELDDPVNRFINAMEPGTYLRPHRHLTPSKDEIFLLLRGRVAVFLFDEEGNILETITLDPSAGVYGAEIGAGVWHGLLVLEPGSVIYEVKQGPFAPLASENFAPWSPAAEDRVGVEKYMESLATTMETESLADSDEWIKKFLFSSCRIRKETEKQTVSKEEILAGIKHELLDMKVVCEERGEKYSFDELIDKIQH